MTLAHEMGHGAQHLEGKIDPNKRYTSKEKLVIEEDNLARYETPIGKELGEYTRKNYKDALRIQRMNNSYEWGTFVIQRPWWHYLNPVNWFRPNTKFNNQNPWTP